ncbi:hypothetical protein [Olsenella sp. Marseille-P4559]|uniref:hypothetical protein n=1 Tax=Olsenella sp. Marseille-P4559 TaxID=2364795 RepID=UPI00103144A4|nr:hypothetical protein [Olsenella sp. Marseille-P4559]
MILNETKLTRDQARKLFNDNLTYSKVSANDVRALQGFLCIEYAQHERNGEHMEMRPSYRKRTAPQITVAESGIGIQSAYLFVSGFYFHGREAISFNDDGYIGFAGWANGTTIQPFLRAFMRWISEWMGVERAVYRTASANAASTGLAPACYGTDAMGHGEAARATETTKTEDTPAKGRERA